MPLRSRPSRPLTIATLVVVAIGTVLPATPLAPLPGFTLLPLRYLIFVAGATLTYLAMVEIAKRRFAKRNRAR